MKERKYMQYKVETTITKLLSWEELSKERQKEEYEKALKDDFFYQDFSDMVNDDYTLRLDELKEEYDLNIEPRYSNGSQHGLLGFDALYYDYDTTSINYMGKFFILRLI